MYYIRNFSKLPTFSLSVICDQRRKQVLLTDFFDLGTCMYIVYIIHRCIGTCYCFYVNHTLVAYMPNMKKR